MSLADLTQFRIEQQDNGLVHFIFDAPRSMNVFSLAAIKELGLFAEWLKHNDAKGVVIRSGKANGFCAGADLTELAEAYQMIVAARPEDRFDIAFEHFFCLSHAIRQMERAGKPIAAAIAGVALGGGCELALGAHYRVLADTPRAMLGLPEYAVGLLPGAGGTQRMTRLVGIDTGLEVLLHGRTFSGQEAVQAGAANRLVPEGDEVAAAEEWLLSAEATAIQPWDRDDYHPLAHADYSAAIERHRTAELARMLGHEPAPLSILECVELGLMQHMDGAIRSEMAAFSSLIQRREPRNMIRASFLGKQAFDKARRAEAIPQAAKDAATKAGEAVASALAAAPALAKAGFGKVDGQTPVQNTTARGYWLESGVMDAMAARNAVAGLKVAIKPIADGLNEDERLIFDHMLVREGIVPAYLGGSYGILDGDWA
jgi:3-hydroxyacyl-CoA dehydrogenase/enoyl-CoA hydratase/3-hydroxybutyryl-CoA epimerase